MADIFTENRRTLDRLDWEHRATVLILVAIFMGGFILAAVGMRWL